MIFVAGSCCRRAAVDDLCRSWACIRRHGTRHLRDVRDVRGDRNARSASGDPNHPGVHPDARDALACRLKLQSWDGRGARSWNGADGCFPLCLPEFLRHDGSCCALDFPNYENHFAADGGSLRLRGAVGDLERFLCDRLTVLCDHSTAFRDRARRSCRGRALRRRDAQNAEAERASPARLPRDLLQQPRSDPARSVRAQHLRRRWHQQRERPFPPLPRSRAASPRRRTAHRRPTKRMQAGASWRGRGRHRGCASARRPGREIFPLPRR
jgi:hypothetical protein